MTGGEQNFSVASAVIRDASHDTTRRQSVTRMAALKKNNNNNNIDIPHRYNTLYIPYIEQLKGVNTAKTSLK